ncbi:MAG: DUF4190 domain-containing protein [Polyangiaceae bacterium]
MSPQGPGAPPPPIASSQPNAPLARSNPFEPPPVGSYGGAPGTTRYAPPTSSEAIGALVCGLLGWACLPMGFIGLWLGYRARKAIQESNGQLGGDGIALAGMIVGAITGGIGLLILLLYFGAIVVALGVTRFK